jgi:hypothetical protein
MYQPRKISSLSPGSDADGLKLYTISASGAEVDTSGYREQLECIKKQKGLDSSLPGFAIMHDGAGCEYLIVGWWRNDNELFVSVSAKKTNVWVEDATKHSFCLWDLEILWHERNSFIRHLYSGAPDLEAYRKDIKGP